MIMAESGMRDYQRLHRHGIFFHDVADAGIGVDDNLVREPLQALAIKGFVIGETLAETPMTVHQRQADRGVSIEHLLGGDHLDLDGIDVEAEFVESDPLDRVVDPAQPGVIPIRTAEERGRGFESHRSRSRVGVRHGRPLSKTIRETPKRSGTGR